MVCIAIPLIALLGISIYTLTGDDKQPIDQVDTTLYKVKYEDQYQMCHQSRLREASNGYYELYLQGDALERGLTFGALMQKELLYQETVFIDQIQQIIPNKHYLRFLYWVTQFFNRNLASYITEEQREQIYGVAQFCTHDYDVLGTPYQRQLNYHGAHDIGHTLQDYMLVGCSSFAAWDQATQDSTLIVGRNFDFYVGDDFAKNKIILVENPSTGYPFISVTWPGMIGVLSGMNAKGLTVTINASKGSMPRMAAMPISLLAREILQYASTIDEAYAIAKKQQTFVSESLLIGSSLDHRAAIIEKSPDKIALYDPCNHSKIRNIEINRLQVEENAIICTNHYQSETFAQDASNLENIKNSDSQSRWLRIQELLNDSVPLNPIRAVEILRDTLGLNNQEIGLTNELALNQCIAHHSVVFQPEKGRMWVSTSPWQFGSYVCYELPSILQQKDFSKEWSNTRLKIEKTNFVSSKRYDQLLQYKRLQNEIKALSVSNDTLLATFQSLNPSYYYTYQIIGDYYHRMNNDSLAIQAYQKALTLPIGKKVESSHIKEKIQQLEK